ncbi:MAG: hypothetical protein M1814_002345 [Vezdaea aestivalis]|nr:MAG: hypothetical protein M1814_002345 [Vezdaea aestivalis]
MVPSEDSGISSGNTTSKISLFHQHQLQINANSKVPSSKGVKHGKKKGSSSVPKFPDLFVSSLLPKPSDVTDSLKSSKPVENDTSTELRPRGPDDTEPSASELPFSPIMDAVAAARENEWDMPFENATAALQFDNGPKEIPKPAKGQVSKVPVPNMSCSPVQAPHSPQSYPNIETPYLYSPPQRYRRASMFSHQASISPHGHPPLPHHPQAHFYGAPQLDLDPQRAVCNMKPGENGGVCKFDSVQTFHSEGRRFTEDLILTGWQGGLDVHRLRKGQSQLVGRLTGLRGLVIDARIIPYKDGPDFATRLQPVVAVVIHGPELTESPRGGLDVKASSPTLSSHAQNETTVDRLLIDTHDVSTPSGNFVTTAEVYSLATNCQLAVLYTTPAVSTPVPLHTPGFDLPNPIGHISIAAAGRFVLVTSGDSGEVFIFHIYFKPTELGDCVISADCIGKTWTSVIPRHKKDHSRHSSVTDLKAHRDYVVEEQSSGGQPLFSLSERWLVYSPPSSSSSFLQGRVTLPPMQSKIPGLTSHRAPLQPAPNCDLETPEGEGMIDWMARGVTQEMIKGAKWVGEKAMQTFSAYWNSNHSHMAPSPQDQGYTPNPQFPPTHAFSNQQAADFNSPALVSFIDLERLARATPSDSSIAPIATFTAPQGCGFLSISPSGLNLLMANAKGDVQIVWDLMRMLPGRITKSSSRLSGFSNKQIIRQVARFTRMTTATFVSAIWAEPTGEKLAMITDRGTVHIYELPSSVSQWPPPRQKTHRSRGDTSSANSLNTAPYQFSAASAATNAVSAAFRYVNNTTQPLLVASTNAPNPNTHQTFGARGFGPLGNYRTPSGQAVAQGLGKGLGAATGTVNNIRNVGENRIHIPLSSSEMQPGCATWLSGKSAGCIAVIGKGSGKIHRVAYRIVDKKGDQRRITVAKKTTSFQLPRLPDIRFAPIVAEKLDLPFPLLSGFEKGFWALRPRPDRSAVQNKASLQMHAEINPSEPYLPFHTDRRMEISIFQAPSNKKRAIEPLVFGEEIPTIKLDFGLFSDEDSDGAQANLVTSMENAKVTGSDDETVEQIVVTTRKRKSKGHTSTSAANDAGPDTVEGFFEDDLEILDFAGERV